MTGMRWGVPQGRLRLTVLLINQTSAVKGVTPPNGILRMEFNKGTLPETSVCVPDVNVSNAMPPLTKIASCPSLTTSWLPRASSHCFPESNFWTI